MPALGFGSKMLSGIEMPITQFWNPVAINDLPAQTDFYAKENMAALRMLHKEAQQPEKLARLIEVYQEILGHGVVRRAEEAKLGFPAQLLIARHWISFVMWLSLIFNKMT